MATQTPNKGVYDEESYDEPLVRDPGHNRAAGNSSDPRGDFDERHPAPGSEGYAARQKQAAGDPSDPRSSGAQGVDRSELASQETQAASGATSALGSSEQALSDRLTDTQQSSAAPSLFRKEEADEGLSRGAKLRGKLLGFSRRRITILIVSGVVAGGGIFGFSILQGPLQFIHLAQLLQKVQLKPNEDFGDGRGAKLMMYAVAGMAERGRLGAGLNAYADIWEQRMIKNTGLRPVYNSKTGRLSGYEIVSEKKDRFDALHEVMDKNPSLRSTFETLSDNGGEILSRDEALERGPIRGTDRKGTSKVIPQNHYILDFRDVNERGFKQARLVTRGVGTAVTGSKTVATGSSRLAEKRGGVKFSVFNDQKKKKDNRADAKFRKQMDEDYEKNVFKRWSQNVKVGVSRDKRATVDNDGDNSDGKADSTNEAAQVNEKVGEAAEEVSTAGSNGEDTKALQKKLIKSGGGAAFAVGIFCSVKDVGDETETFKYTNNILPLERLGWGVAAMGGGVMAGDSVNLDEMGVMSKLLYDKEDGTSVMNARQIQAELGQPQTGPDAPAAAKLGKMGDKGDVFQAVDAIASVFPPLGLACDALGVVGGLPIIRDIGSIASAGLDAAVKGVTGTSLDDFTQQGLALIAGEGVNPLARGAEFGNLANTGMFLAANDQAISMGGTGLSDAEVADLKQNTQETEASENSTKPVLARYFDPYDSSSLTAKLIDDTPTTTQVASMPLSFMQTFGSSFTQLFSHLSPQAKAASSYDYGVKKYGFSIQDQNSDMFDNPYENADIVEPQLAQLNDKYGKCFGTTISEDGKIQTDKAVNILKLEKDDEFKVCRQGNTIASTEQHESVTLLQSIRSGLGSFASIFAPKVSAQTPPATSQNSENEMFKRYSFYIADTISAKSLACFEDNDEACTELGVGSNASAAAPADSAATAGDANMKETITVKTPGKFITMPKKYSCDGYTTRIDSRIAASLAYLITKYDMCADDGLADGHKSHGAGLGVDIKPRNNNDSKDEWKKTVEAAARDMGWTGDSADEGKGGKGCAPSYSGYGQCVGGNGEIPKWVRWIGYNGDVDHGDPWHVFGGSYAHIHIGWDTPNKDGVAPSIIANPVSEVYTFPAPVPEDLKDLIGSQ